MEAIINLLEEYFAQSKDESYKNNLIAMKKLEHRLISHVDEAVNLEEIQRLAFSKLSLNTLSYYMTGANDEYTLKRNMSIYQQIFLYPSVLKDVKESKTSVSVLGQKISIPVIIAPTALHKLCHPDGEEATARAATACGGLICLSSLSSSSISNVAKASGDGHRWFQLYVKSDRTHTHKVIKMCEKYGYTAIVVTVDAPTLGYRDRDFKVKFAVPKNVEYEDLTTDEKTTKVEHKKDNKPKNELFSFFASNMDSTLTWDFIPWLRSVTKLKIILKGVHRVDDALKAQEMGVDGIVVSNHGARQLDTVPSTMEMLYPISKALKKIKNNNMEIYVDGGIRRGTDIIKAIALGARAVFIGRPSLWGLAAGGQHGVERVLELLRQELMVAMKLSGVSCLEDITEDLLRFRSDFTKF